MSLFVYLSMHLSHALLLLLRTSFRRQDAYLLCYVKESAYRESLQKSRLEPVRNIMVKSRPRPPTHTLFVIRIISYGITSHFTMLCHIISQTLTFYSSKNTFFVFFLCAVALWLSSGKSRTNVRRVQVCNCPL